MSLLLVCSESAVSLPVLEDIGGDWRLTQELPDGALITQILPYRLVLRRRHRSEHTHAVAQLSLLPTAAVETVTLPTEGV